MKNKFSFAQRQNRHNSSGRVRFISFHPGHRLLLAETNGRVKSASPGSGNEINGRQEGPLTTAGQEIREGFYFGIAY